MAYRKEIGERPNKPSKFPSPHPPTQIMIIIIMDISWFTQTTLLIHTLDNISAMLFQSLFLGIFTFTMFNANSVS